MSYEIQEILLEYSDELRALYERVLGIEDFQANATIGLHLKEYMAEFGEFESGLIPTILQRHDLEQAFERIVQTDQPAALHLFQKQNQANYKSAALSFELFKQSLILLASVCRATQHKLRKEEEEWQKEKDDAVDSFGGLAPNEWDQGKNAVWWKILISLDRLSPRQFRLQDTDDEDE